MAGASTGERKKKGTGRELLRIYQRNLRPPTVGRRVKKKKRTPIRNKKTGRRLAARGGEEKKKNEGGGRVAKLPYGRKSRVLFAEDKKRRGHWGKAL